LRIETPASRTADRGIDIVNIADPAWLVAGGTFHAAHTCEM